MGSLQDDHQVMLKPARDEQDFLLAMELASGAVLPMTIKSATELGLLEIMAKASPTQLSSSEIASQLPTNNKKAPIILDRMLRLLASYSFLTCNLVSNKDGSVQRLYGLTPVSKYFVPNKDGVSLAPTLLIIQDQVNMDSWSCAKDALLEGSVPFMKAHNGMDGFAAAAKDERINNLFNQSMHNHTTIVMKEILEIYKGFEGLNQLVDVAGGLGVEHVGGDMFVEVPKGQAIFMKWILHDWSDEECSKILKNCYEAIPESGKVILVESIVPEFPETDIVSKNIASLDVHLSNLFPGAKERTLAEFKALATGVGFADMKVICRVYCYWVIEFYKTI
ncbi:caffeic acid 3-O-methyltransferase isoform X2 [Citrus clementina]|uniref:caffeic acid 3-O-methyltransferase isoform X2 n=1 Tax=Citrus clementina TaxID=85681 RepID=UPI000CED1212|nr:caffeic acid 3-O-methyltransferase isoform X2 [Citrus x clementina]